MKCGDTVWLCTKLDANGELLAIHGEVLSVDVNGVRIMKRAPRRDESVEETVYFVPWGNIDHIR